MKLDFDLNKECSRGIFYYYYYYYITRGRGRSKRANSRRQKDLASPQASVSLASPTNPMTFDSEDGN